MIILELVDHSVSQSSFSTHPFFSLSLAFARQFLVSFEHDPHILSFGSQYHKFDKDCLSLSYNFCYLHLHSIHYIWAYGQPSIWGRFSKHPQAPLMVQNSCSWLYNWPRGLLSKQHFQGYPWLIPAIFVLLTFLSVFTQRLKIQNLPSVHADNAHTAI